MKAQRGFTLVEIVATIVVVAAGVAGIAALFVQGAGHGHEPYVRQRALAVAQAFMDEILAKRWDENTPLGGGCVDTGSGYCPTGPAMAGIGTEEAARADYDDIDDYNAVVAQDPPQDGSGNPMPGYAGYRVTVTVTQPAAAWNGIPAADVRRVQVRVTAPGGDSLDLVSYRVNL